MRHSRARAAVRLMGLLLRADPARTGLHMAASVVAMLMVPLGAYALKLVVDALTQRDLPSLRSAGLLVVAAATLALLVDTFAQALLTRLVERANGEISRYQMKLAGSVETVAHLEHPEYLDRIEVLRSAGMLLGSTPAVLPSLVGLVLQLGASAALLIGVYPPLGLLLLVAVPGVLVSEANHRDTMRTELLRARHDRLSWMLSSSLVQTRNAAELRVFDVATEVKNRITDEMSRSLRSADALLVRKALRGLAARGTVVLGAGVALFVIAQRATAGAATVGDIVLVLTLCSQIDSQLEGLVQSVGHFGQSLHAAEQLVWLEDFGAESRRVVEPRSPVPRRLVDGIRLEQVSFTYPGGRRRPPALNEVSLHLPAGKTIALVGENGAGKSTLVKLLARMYSPTWGRVLIDGADLAAIAATDWRRQVSGSFQDFAKFNFVARKSVGIGDLERMALPGAIELAVKQADAASLVDEMPQGLDTQLGRAFGGVELSTGEWQRIALARGFMRPEPLLLILDEPSSALDPESEYALFKRYMAAARRAAQDTGSITVVVSHRLAVATLADIVVVFDGGAVVEVGPPRELLKRRGIFQELYNLQVQAYAPEAVTPAGEEESAC